eukprot:symbB.v1.2.036641.t1/scaffold5217.1/size29716/2
MCRQENLVLPLRGYQRHCLAVAYHQVSPQALTYLGQLYSVLLTKARASAKAGSNHQVFQSIANAMAYIEGGDVPKALWRHIESLVMDVEPSSLKVEELHLLHLHTILVSQTLGVMSSEELQSSAAPVCRHDMAPYVAKVTAIASSIAWTSTSVSPLREDLLETSGRVLAQLYRICHRNWVPISTFHAPEAILEGFKAAMKELTETVRGSSSEIRMLPSHAERLLRHVPQAIPFEQRVALLRARVQVAREAGGIVAAQKLAEVHEVVLFDFGSRGLGGRCGHREDPAAGSRFDHGVQFLSVGPNDAKQWKDLIAAWLAEGLLERWTPRLQALERYSGGYTDGPATAIGTRMSFFDVLTAQELYVSPGGMRNLCEGLASKGKFRSIRGCRVRRLEKCDGSYKSHVWKLYGNPGNQAHHEATELDVKDADDQYLGSFKTVVLSDVMLSFPSWHRAALLGLETAVPDLVELLRHTEMAPLFSLMVSFEAGATEKLDVDAALVRHDVLQWVCRMSSKPGGQSLTQDCWVCVSTRDFAEACLKDEPMSREAVETQGRVYKPQEKDYLSADPADRMAEMMEDV